MKKILGKPHEINKTLISLIERVKINDFYLKNRKDFRDQVNLLKQKFKTTRHDKTVFVFKDKQSNINRKIVN